MSANTNISHRPMRAASVKNLVLIALVSALISSGVSFMSLSIAQLTAELADVGRTSATESAGSQGEFARYEKELFDTYFERADDNGEIAGDASLSLVASMPATVLRVAGRIAEIAGKLLEDLSDPLAISVIENVVKNVQGDTVDQKTVENAIREMIDVVTSVATKTVEPAPVKEPEYEKILKTLAELLQEVIPKMEALFKSNGLAVPTEAKTASTTARTAVIEALTPCRTKTPECAVKINLAVEQLDTYNELMETVLITSADKEAIRLQIKTLVAPIVPDFADDVVAP